MRKVISTLIVLGAVVAGCSEEEAAKKRAGATILAKGGSMLAGTVTFVEDGEGVLAVVQVTNAPPGEHGVHVHAGMSCADDPDAGAMGAAAGALGHYDPDMTMNHGKPNDDDTHAGDLGNIEVRANGSGTLEVRTDRLQIGSGNNVIGRAIVIHAMEDDLETQPSGDSGGRIGCGVIQ